MPSSQPLTGPRHRWPDRAFHWVMALSVIVLAASALLPILGIRFDWVPIHWMTGLVLVAAILFHFVRVATVHGLTEMTPRSKDARQILADFRRTSGDPPPVKYDAYQKAYHWVAAVTVLALVVTGLLMLAKIDTPFWRRDPSILSDGQWGVVYVIHGLSTLLILYLVAVHVYFAILPEHRTLLRSMLWDRKSLPNRNARHEQQV